VVSVLAFDSDFSVFVVALSEDESELVGEAAPPFLADPFALEAA
jgi:hypothetical protein